MNQMTETSVTCSNKSPVITNSTVHLSSFLAYSFGAAVFNETVLIKPLYSTCLAANSTQTVKLFFSHAR